MSNTIKIKQIDQTQLAAFVNDILDGTGAVYTANRALVTDGAGDVTTSSVTATELGYLSGVTSAIQTQFNNLGSTYLALAGGTMTGALTLDAASLLKFGGATASYPALKRNGTELQVRLADDSGYANLAINTLYVGSNGQVTTPGALGGWRFYSGLGPIMDGSGGQVIFDTDANYTLALRYSTNAQTLRVYGTYTDGSNFVRASLAATSTTVTLSAETAGTGADNVDVYVTPAGSGLVQLGAGANKVAIDSSGNLGVANGFTVSAGGSYFQLANIGATYIFNTSMFYGNTPIQIGRLSTGGPVSAIEANSTAVFSWNGDAGIGRNADGVVEVNNGTLGTYRDLKLRTLTATNSGSNAKLVDFTGQDWAIRDGTGGGGGIYISDASFSYMAAFQSVGIGISHNTALWWAAFPNSQGPNTAIARSSNGVVQINTGANNSFGDLQLRTLQGFYSYTDGSNYQGFKLTSGASSVTLSAETAGTGADDIDLILSPAGAGKVGIGTATLTQLLNVGPVFKVSSTGAVTIKTGGTGLGGTQGLVADDGSGIALENGTFRLEQSGAACRTALRNGAIFLGTGIIESLQYSDSTNQFWLSKPVSFATSNASTGVYDMIRWGDGVGTESSNPTYVSVSTVKTAATEYGLTFDVSTAATKSERMRLSPTGFLGIGTSSPTHLLSLGGNSARTIWMERHTTSDTAGNNLTVQAGSATSGATNKAGGYLDLLGGISTGTGESGVRIKGYVAGSSGTSDTSASTMIEVLGNKVGFFGVTPVVRQTTGIAAATFVANTSAIADDTATWGGYTAGQIVTALKNVGILT